MKRTIIFFVLLALSLASMARPVSQDVARRVAQTWLQAQGMKNPAALQDITVQTPFTEFYVFAAPEGGFVLVSGDDCVKPVLAYSVENRFVTENMPENIRTFLDGYEQEIRWWKRHSSNDIPTSPLQVADGAAPSALPGAWRELLDGTVPPPQLNTAVAPLMTTTWDQSPYYNALCPTNGGEAERAVTGCVATATAQVMKYHNHPTTGYGSHTYTSNRVVNGVQYTYNNLTANFGATTYQWSQMPNALTSASSTAQVNAVATLMYHIGVADEMAYSPVASGANNAYSMTMHPTSQAALMQYFKYRPDMAYVERGFYSDAVYCALLRSELDQQRPILYSGRDPSGGHSFVLDGYNNNDYFHVNWGWGSSNDGYYAIGALNPGEGGTGGNATYTFNLDNSVLIGIRPNTSWSTTGTTTVTASMQAGSPAGSSVTVYNRTDGSTPGTFAFGDTVVLAASLPEGYRFNGWTDGSTSNPREIYANGGSYSFSATGVSIGGSDTVGYCNGNITNYSSYAGGVKLPASALDASKQMTSVMFYAVDPGVYDITVYTGSNHETTAATASYTVSSGAENDWQFVELATPVASTSDIWIIISSNDNGVWPMCMTTYSGVPSSLLLVSGGTIYEYGGNWGRSAMVKGIFHGDVEVSGDTVSYCGNSEPLNAVGNASGGTFQWGVMFPAGTLNNNYLKSVMLYVRPDQTGNYTLNLYRGGDTVPGTLAHTQTVNFTVGGWQEVQLNAAFAIDNQNLWVTFTATGTYMMTTCEYTGAPNSNWLNNGGTWVHVTDFGFNYSWLIKAVLSATSSGSYPPPTIAIDGQWQVGTGVAYTYTATATAGATVSWSFPGATPATATGTTASATWNTPGMYYVVGTATNAYGTSHDTIFVTAVNYRVGDTVSYVLVDQHVTNVGASGNDFGWGIMMPAAFLTGRTQLTGVMAVISEIGSYTLTVYQGGSDAPQTQIGTYTVNVTTADTAAGHYKTFTFPTPLAINSASNLWVAIYSSGMNYPAGATYATTDPNSDWTYYNSNWYHLPQLGLNYSWEIKLLMGQTSQPTQYTITVGSNNNAWGTVTGGGTYNSGATATLTATPASGYHFVEWQDGNTQNPRTITVTGNAAYMATFAEDVSCPAITSFPYGESFDEGTGCWTAIDGNNDNSTWQPSAGISGDNSTILPHSGSAMMASFSWNGNPMQANEYLVSPQIVLPAGQAITLSWWFTVNGSYPEDKLAVRLSTTGNAVSNFSTTLIDITPTAANGNWTQQTLDLSAYAGQSIYLAFHHHDSYDMNYILLDDIQITATAAPTQYTITVASNNNAWGTVSGGGTYNSGATATLTATPASGYRFVSWNDNNTQNPRTVTVTGNATYIATFEAIPPTQYTITVASNNNAWGTVSGGGTYNSGATATLTATPASGYRFVSWNDNNTQNPRTVTVTGNATYIATFEAIPPTQYTITVASNNNAWGTVSGGGTYNEGSTITLTATPASGYRFVTWNDGNTQNPRTVTVTGNATYIATFEAIPPTQYTITVASNNNAWGTVSGGGTYNAGAIATLTPIPAAGYRFVCWQDGNTENPRVFTVTGDAAFIATFESTVGIDAVEAAAVTIAPNPATECAVVNGLKAGADVVVVDINGKIRLGATAECDRMALDVSDLSAGVYFVRVSDGTATAVRKLIVK